MPNAERRGRDATGIRSGMGWFGMEGFAFGAGAGAGAVAEGAAAGAAETVVDPLAAGDGFAGGAFFVAATVVAGEGEVEGLAGSRGVLRLVALVSVGCIVGGRTVELVPAGGDPAVVGVGGKIDANVSPEYPGAGPGMVGGAGDADGGRTCIAPGMAGGDMADPTALGVPGVAGCLGSFSFFFLGALEPMGGPPGVPGKGCLRGRPRPRCGVGPGVTPGVPGVPGADAAAAAAAAAALAAFLLGGLDGVPAAGVDGAPVAGMKGADVGVPIGIGMPLEPYDEGPGTAPNGGTKPGVPGIELYADGGPYCGDGIGKPLGPA